MSVTACAVADELRRRQEEEARLAAEEERRRQEEQRKREEEARLEAIGTPRSRRSASRPSAPRSSRRFLEQQEHARQLAMIHQDEGKKKLRNTLIAVGVGSFLLIGGGLGSTSARSAEAEAKEAA